MSVDVSVETVVARSRSDTAAYMFDPAYDVEWTTGITSSRPAQPGRLATGSRVTRTAKFLGRTFDYQFEVIEGLDDTFVHMRVERPFPMEIRYELDDVPGGTRVRIHTWGDPKGFFKLAGPLMAPRVRKSISADLANLKRNLEAGGG